MKTRALLRALVPRYSLADLPQPEYWVGNTRIRVLEAR